MLQAICLYSGLIVIVGYLLRRYYFSGGYCTSKNRLDGKVAIVTGGNTGIGYETALDFAKRGAFVIIACRDAAKANSAADQIKLEANVKEVKVEYLDLADLSSVRNFAARMNVNLNRLDILVNNAGCSLCPYWKTKDGFELQFGTNHLGHFLLTNLLLNLITKSRGRIVIVSSLVHYMFGMNWDDLQWEKCYNTVKAYSQSKLANVLFAKELARRLEGTGVVAVSLHPGVVRTEVTRHIGEGIFFLVPLLLKLIHPIWYVLTKSRREGAQTTIYCSVVDLDEIIPYNGGYFTDCRPKTPSRDAMNAENATRLWQISERLVNL